MENYKLSKLQLTFLVLMCCCGLSVGLSSHTLINYSGRDLWIVVLLSIPLNISICVFYFFLSKKMDGMSLSEFILNRFGNGIGFIINFAYFIFFLLVTVLTFRVLGNLLIAELIPETPLWFIMTPFIITAFFAVYKGIGTIARCAEILVPMMTVMFVVSVSLLMKKADFSNFLPVLENGFTSMPKSLSIFLSYTGLSLIGIFSFFPKNISIKKRDFKPLLFGILFAIAMNFIIAMLVVLIVGPKIGKVYYYPGYILAREVEFGRVLKRSDAFVVILWFYAVYINATIYSYTTYETAKSIFKFKNRLISIALLTALVSYLSQLEVFNIIYYFDFIKTYWLYLSFIFGLFLPIVFLFKKKK